MRTLLFYLASSLFLLGSATNIQAQQLSLDQLTNLSGQDIEQVNDYLASRGWEFDDASQEEEDSQAHASWAFRKTITYFDNDDARAQAWLQLNNPGADQSIMYQTSNKLHYDALRSRITAYRMERVGSNVLDGGISTTYVGANFIVSTSIRTSTGNQRPVYLIQIQRKEAYLRRLLTDPSEEESSEEMSGD